MKKIIFLIVLLLIPNIILANEIYNIDMNIYVDNNGTAHVIEEWQTNLNEGTEGYKPYYNLGTSEITNFKVKINGEDYISMVATGDRIIIKLLYKHHFM